MAAGDKIYIADKPTLDAVKADTGDTRTKVGATGDTGGSAASGSIFGKMNKLIGDMTAHMTRWNAEKANQITNIDAYTATNHTPSATGTLSQKLSKLISDVSALQTSVNSKGAVKSIQRGIMGGADYADDTHTITISAVNPAKCAVSFENRIDSGDSRVSYGPELISLTATELTVKRPLFNGTPKGSAMWQIIEFY